MPPMKVSVNLSDMRVGYKAFSGSSRRSTPKFRPASICI